MSKERPGESGTPDTGAETQAADLTHSETFAEPSTDRPTKQNVSIPGYELHEVLGEGGMGIVFEAEQQNPRRRVALKVMRGSAVASRSWTELFRREIATLARLRHPCIAQIFESGVSTAGEPFLSMELVRGQTLDRFLDDRPTLGASELRFRLRLFRAICLGIHHAHQRGVIHRDLKPTNILISDSVEDSSGLPLPKILDFGIARLMDDDEPSERTALGVVRGTLAYMSPEQSQGHNDAVDTRTDVYALGVVLYEMLTGKRPVDVGAKSVVDAIQAVAQQEPLPLQRAWPDSALKLDADLATIVHKSLEKEADRRYASCEAFALDIERYLNDEAILARPATASYQFRKFAKRNRVLVAGVAATSLALLGGVVASTYFALSEAEQRRQAEEERQRAVALLDFQIESLQLDAEETGRRLVGAIRRRLDQGQAPANASFDESLSALMQNVNWTDVARDVVDENILRPASRSAGTRFADQPLFEARFRETIGTIYNAVGLLNQAHVEYSEVKSIFDRELGSDSREALGARFTLAQIDWRRGNLDDAARDLQQLESTLAKRLGPTDALTLRTRWGRGMVHFRKDELDESIDLLRSVLQGQQTHLGPKDADTLQSLVGLGGALFRKRLFSEAAETYETFLERTEDGSSGAGTSRNAVIINLASVRMGQGDLDGAVALLAPQLATLSTSLGDDHPDTLDAMNNLGMLYSRLGRHQESYELGKRTLAARVRTLGEGHERTRRAMNNLAVRLQDLERYDEAAAVLQDLLELDRQVALGTASHALHMHTFAELHIATGSWTEAREMLLPAIEIYRNTGHGYRGFALVQLAETDLELRRKEDAIRSLREAVEIGYGDKIDFTDEKWTLLADDPRFAELIARAQSSAGS